MDRKFLYDAILGGNKALMDAIWPHYLRFMQETQVSQKGAEYFLNRERLVDDFYRWLHQTQQNEVLRLIDRRKNPERRTDMRIDQPGRREEDKRRAESFLQKTP